MSTEIRRHAKVGAEASGSVLSVSELTYSYQRGGDELYGGLSYSFPTGALSVVTGPSGRGKSTLLYLLGLMVRPTSGAVVVDQRRVDNLRDGERSLLRASRFGFVFQDSVLDLTRPILDSVIEPALYAGSSRAEAEPRALALLTLLGMEDRATHRPGEISGGQGQRVAIARALMNQPDVILADEPTGNLDLANTDVVLDTLRSAAGSGCTVVLATHDPAVVAQADYLLEL